MAKVDRLKEEIGWLKLVFGATVAIDASLIAWLARNYEFISGVLVVCTILGVVLVTGAGAWASRLAMKRFVALEVE